MDAYSELHPVMRLLQNLLAFYERWLCIGPFRLAVYYSFCLTAVPSRSRYVYYWYTFVSADNPRPQYCTNYVASFCLSFYLLFCQKVSVAAVVWPVGTTAVDIRTRGQGTGTGFQSEHNRGTRTPRTPTATSPILIVTAPSATTHAYIYARTTAENKNGVVLSFLWFCW